VGVAGVCAEHAVLFARHAGQIGADAVIAMTPYQNKLQDGNLVAAYYRAIAEAACLPVFIQNHAVGSELSVATMTRVIRQVDRVEYIKEETSPPTHKLSQVLEQAGPRLKGVFGGAGGRYLLLEHPRGVAGQMPGCHVTDVVVRLWDELETGALAAAQQTYSRLAPLFAFETLYPGAVYKEVLRRRGVIRSARCRGLAEDSMDAEDHRALDRILTDLEPLFTWRG
jgi:4-hydroxy-tetrahydrodipicolinate synthase